MADHYARLSYLKGYEDAIEKARKLVTDTCQKRSDELTAHNTSEVARALRADVAFTRERILDELARVGEWVAVEKVHHERAQAKIDEENKIGPMSQHCRVTNDHAHCPGENTLGTSRCMCPCHGGAR